MSPSVCTNFCRISWASVAEVDGVGRVRDGAGGFGAVLLEKASQEYNAWREGVDAPGKCLYVTCRSRLCHLVGKSCSDGEAVVDEQETTERRRGWCVAPKGELWEKYAE